MSFNTYQYCDHNQTPNSMPHTSNNVRTKWNVQKKVWDMSKSFYWRQRSFFLLSLLKCQIAATCVHSRESFQLSGLLSREQVYKMPFDGSGCADGVGGNGGGDAPAIPGLDKILSVRDLISPLRLI